MDKRNLLGDKMELVVRLTISGSKIRRLLIYRILNELRTVQLFRYHQYRSETEDITTVKTDPGQSMQTLIPL